MNIFPRMVGGDPSRSPSPFTLSLLTFSIFMGNFQGSFRPQNRKDPLKQYNTYWKPPKEKKKETRKKKQQKNPSCRPCLYTWVYTHPMISETAINRLFFPFIIFRDSSAQMIGCSHCWITSCILYLYIYVLLVFKSANLLLGIMFLQFRTLHSRWRCRSPHIVDGPPSSDPPICRCRCSSSRTTRRTRCLPAPSIRNLQ